MCGGQPQGSRLATSKKPAPATWRTSGFGAKGRTAASPEWFLWWPACVGTRFARRYARACSGPPGTHRFTPSVLASAQDAPGGHLRSCYARHFACFPGLCQVCYFPDGWESKQTWKWIAGMQPRSGFLAASFHVTDQSLTRAGWQSLALKQSRHPAEVCCLWARRQAEASVSIPLKKVA